MKILKLFLISFLLISTFTSCEDDIEPDVFSIVGVYEAHVQGLSGPFSMSISADRGDNILIEAPFDGFNWSTVEADTDDRDDFTIDLEIFDQELQEDVFIEGEGFFTDNSFQFDYSIEFENGDIFDFTMIGSKI